MAEKLKILLDNMSQEEFDKDWKEVTDLNLTKDDIIDITDLNLTQDNIMVIGIGGNQSHLLDKQIKSLLLLHMVGICKFGCGSVDVHNPESIDDLLLTSSIETKKKLLENLETIIEQYAPQRTNVMTLIPKVAYEYVDYNSDRYKNDVWRKKNKKCKGGQFFHK